MSLRPRGYTAASEPPVARSTRLPRYRFLTKHVRQAAYLEAGQPYYPLTPLPAPLPQHHPATPFPWQAPISSPGLPGKGKGCWGRGGVTPSAATPANGRHLLGKTSRLHHTIVAGIRAGGGARSRQLESRWAPATTRRWGKLRRGAPCPGPRWRQPGHPLTLARGFHQRLYEPIYPAVIEGSRQQRSGPPPPRGDCAAYSPRVR